MVASVQPPTKLLTIAIPTRNRAAHVKRQLRDLTHQLRGLESSVQILLCDNCSTDDTLTVMQQWRDSLTVPLDVSIRRHPHNVGVVRNVAGCIERAATPFVWTVGDDDVLHDRAVSFVIHALRARPDLASILLNFRSVGKTRYER